ncbi:MAG: hypothetical protein ACC628_20425 [Pirellulaceae bacterium]
MNKRKSFLLRMNPGLYREIEAWAQQELRSINGQIEYLLKEAVSRHRGTDRPDDSAREPSSERHP